MQFFATPFAPDDSLPFKRLIQTSTTTWALSEDASPSGMPGSPASSHGSDTSEPHLATPPPFLIMDQCSAEGDGVTKSGPPEHAAGDLFQGMPVATIGGIPVEAGVAADFAHLHVRRQELPPPPPEFNTAAGLTDSLHLSSTGVGSGFSSISSWAPNTHAPLSSMPIPAAFGGGNIVSGYSFPASYPAAATSQAYVPTSGGYIVCPGGYPALPHGAGSVGYPSPYGVPAAYTGFHSAAALCVPFPTSQPVNTYSGLVPNPPPEPARKAQRDREKRFPCPDCGKLFTRAFNLQTHVASHRGIKPFDCPAPDCLKSFSRKHDLGRHLTAVHETWLLETGQTGQQAAAPVKKRIRVVAPKYNESSTSPVSSEASTTSGQPPAIVATSVSVTSLSSNETTAASTPVQAVTSIRVDNVADFFGSFDFTAASGTGSAEEAHASGRASR